MYICVCVYIYTYVYIYIIYIHIHIYTYMYIHIYIHRCLICVYVVAGRNALFPEVCKIANSWGPAAQLDTYIYIYYMSSILL